MAHQFDDAAWADLARLFDTPGYAGYKPDQGESPNSDGKVDIGKRYLHVAPKYNPPLWAQNYVAAAHYEACRIAEKLKVPDAFYPRHENSTLRVLDYPAGTGTVEHTDFDLFTVNLWRSTPEDHEQHEVRTHDGARWWTSGTPSHHTGRIGTLVGMGDASPHRVPARDYPQRAIVYFAMPAMAAAFPCVVFERDADGNSVPCRTVKEWLAVVYSQSRVDYAKK